MDTDYFRIFDYPRYVDGPTSWPSVVALPLLGVALGLLVGVVARAVPGPRPVLLAAAAAITGLLTGAVGARFDVTMTLPGSSGVR